MIGSEPVRGDVSGALGEPITVRILDEEAASQATFRLQSDWWPGEPVWSGLVNGRPTAVKVEPLLNGYGLACRGVLVGAHVYTEAEARLAGLMPQRSAPDTAKLLLCPMPGQLKALHVAPGQEVKAGDSLCVVEAMKMENVLRAERDGIVSAIRAKPGDGLAVDAVIMEFA
jgi:propionyl-CoA carboxylase alpha chain